MLSSLAPQIQDFSASTDPSSHNCSSLLTIYAGVLDLTHEKTPPRKLDCLMGRCLQYLHDCERAISCPRCLSGSLNAYTLGMIRQSILRFIEQKLTSLEPSAAQYESSVEFGRIHLTGQLAFDIQGFILEQILRKATFIEQRLSYIYVESPISQ